MPNSMTLPALPWPSGYAGATCYPLSLSLSLAIKLYVYIRPLLILMQTLSYPTETVSSNKITRKRVVLSYKDSPRKILGRRPQATLSLYNFVPLRSTSGILHSESGLLLRGYFCLQNLEPSPAACIAALSSRRGVD